MSHSILDENKSIKGRFIDENYLFINEFFSSTIQGEGFHIGTPSVFLRLAGCHNGCYFCDSKESWKEGRPYHFKDIVKMMKQSSAWEELRNGSHLVITGGSPLYQQEHLFEFLIYLRTAIGMKIYIQVENECSILPSPYMRRMVDYWNNSPKLSSSRTRTPMNIFKDTVAAMVSLEGTFKFVALTAEDVKEVFDTYIKTNIIPKNRVFIMPCCTNNEEYSKIRLDIINLCVQYGFRYSPRYQIITWNDMRCV